MQHQHLSQDCGDAGPTASWPLAPHECPLPGEVAPCSEQWRILVNKDLKRKYTHKPEATAKSKCRCQPKKIRVAVWAGAEAHEDRPQDSLEQPE